MLNIKIKIMVIKTMRLTFYQCIFKNNEPGVQTLRKRENKGFESLNFSFHHFEGNCEILIKEI